MTSPHPSVGYLAQIALYGDLRQRLQDDVELVDLTTTPATGIADAIGELDVLIYAPRIELTAAHIGAADRLRTILSAGAGYDGIPIEAATARGILVTNQAGRNDEAVAEHAIGLLLAVVKRIAEGDRRVRSDHTWSPAMFVNHEIRGWTLGIVGLGAIGRRLAQIAIGGFDMKVVAHDPFVMTAPAGVSMLGLDELLSSSDVVSVNVPLLDSTRGLIGEREFALMKPTAYLINTARGYIVDQAAMTTALAEGQLRGAGLDVFDGDVLEPGHPLRAMEHVVLTPHIAGPTEEAHARKAEWQAEAVFAVLRGEVPATANVVDIAAIEPFIRRFGDGRGYRQRPLPTGKELP